MPTEVPDVRDDRRVFLEIGVSRAPGGAGRTRAAGPTEAWSVAHVLATEGQPANMPWQVEADTPDAARGAELTVLPQLSGVPAGYVRLNLALRSTPEADATLPTPVAPAAESPAVKTSLLLKDQQTAVVNTEASASLPSQTLLITPYVVRHEGELRRLLECRLQARSDVESTP